MGSALHHLEQASTFRCYSSGEFSAASASPQNALKEQIRPCLQKDIKGIGDSHPPHKASQWHPLLPQQPLWIQHCHLEAPSHLTGTHFCSALVPVSLVTCSKGQDDSKCAPFFGVFQVLWEQPTEMRHGWRIVMQYLCLPLLYLCICVYRLHIPNVHIFMFGIIYLI